MSRSRAKWWLWIFLLVALPVPYYMGDTELAPTLRLIFLTSLYVGIALEEGLTGTTAIFTQVAAGTAAVYMALLLGVAAVLSRLIWRLESTVARRACVLGLAGLLLGASLFEIYDTPLSSSRMRSSIQHVLR